METSSESYFGMINSQYITVEGLKDIARKFNIPYSGRTKEDLRVTLIYLLCPSKRTEDIKLLYNSFQISRMEKNIKKNEKRNAELRQQKDFEEQDIKQELKHLEYLYLKQQNRLHFYEKTTGEQQELIRHLTQIIDRNDAIIHNQQQKIIINHKADIKPVSRIISDVILKTKGDISCCICYDSLNKENYSLSTCGHDYCKSCFNKMKNKPICAICRQNL